MAEISLQEYIQEIEEAVERGQYDEAVAHGRHVLQHYPKHLETYRLLGKAMLEAGQEDLAEDMFRRVLSGDPDDFVARVGMSIIADRRGDLQQAVWHMERAFELTPDNEAIQEELRRLYGRRDGVEPTRLQLTRGGLARLHMRGNLLSRAIEEFRELLAEQPERVDLQVALAEALWRNEQRVQAEEACLQVLEELPYCLRANLILGEIWTRGGRDEGWVHLQRAEALDPENREAAELFGDASPLERREVRLPRLEYVPPERPEEQPAWLRAAGLPVTPAEEERALIDLEATMEARIEIPAWLEEVSSAEDGEAPAAEEAAIVEEEGFAVPEWLLAQTVEAEMAEGVVEEPSAPEEEVPEWLREVGEGVSPPPVPEGPEPVGERPPEPEVPDWLAEAGLPSMAEEEVGEEGAVPSEVPGWPEEPVPPEEAEEPLPEPPVPAEIPEWLREMAPPEMRKGVGVPPTVPEVSEGEGAPEWLAETVTGPPAEGAGIPDWLAEVGEVPSEPAEPAEPEGEAVPSWLEEEGLPSGDEALAWLESLAAGKEEELRAAAAAEGEARMAEIMGRAPEKPPPAEPEPVAEEPVPPPIEAEVGPEAEVEVPEWLMAAAAPEAVGAPEEPVVPGVSGPPAEAPEPEELAPPEVPRAEVPPAEPEAFGWTAFGVEAGPPEPAPPEAAPEEGFGWTEFEAEAAPPEEAAPVIEIPLEAAVAPELAAPLPEAPPEEIAVPPVEGPPEPALPPVEIAPPPVEEVPVEVEVLPEGVADLREYVRAHPRDHQAMLALARELWQAGLYSESLEAYSRLLRSGKWVEEIVADMEAHVEERSSDSAVQRVLGDAYMRAGRLAEALEVYREALESL